MISKSAFDTVWDGATPFQIKTEYDMILPVGPGLCQWAEPLRAFAEEIVATLDRTSPPVKFRQAKYLLTERYMEYRAKAPRAHRDNLGSKKHICLYHVFVQAYEYVTRLQLTAIPPQLDITHIPPPPAVPIVKQPSMNTIFGISDDWYPGSE
ncbi:MAG: hypothetical protein ACR2MQ_06850 [Gemmatimonadaceae bacterium]